MFGGIAARSGRRAERTAAYSDRADRLKPNIVFSKRDSYQRRGHLTVCKVEFFRLTLPRSKIIFHIDTVIVRSCYISILSSCHCVDRMTRSYLVTLVSGPDPG